MKLSVILAESALELVPKEIWKSPAVESDSRRRGAEPSKILLDRSFHHSAMGRLKEAERRGRPDLVHEAILSVSCTPLYLQGLVRLYIHTRSDLVLEFAEKTRVPKSYFRFRGLMEKALSERPTGELVEAYPGTLAGVVKKMSADRVFGLSVQGKAMGAEELGKRIADARSPCALIGGFPRGHFSQETVGLVDELVRIDSMPLDAHVVAARVVYEAERAAGRFND